MKYFNLYIACACLLFFGSIHAQQTPAKKQSKALSIEGATAHLGNGKVIENALIMFNEGKITFIGSAHMRIARIGKVIDAKGKHVYPGFIIPNSTLGLVEIDAVKASDDDSEIGTWNPNIRSLIAYNAESKVVESMRPNGVLLGQITPRGGRISGTSSVVQFDAWNWEDAAVKTDEGIHINWPSNFSRGRSWLGEDPGLKMNKAYADQVKAIEDYFNNAKAYSKATPSITNLAYEALKGIFDGSKKLYVNVNDEKGIIDAVNFSKKNNIANTVIVGGQDAYKVADILTANNIPVILNRVHSRPNQTDDDYDLPYKTAKLLVDQGVIVALQANGQMERMNTRNLPFYAGTTVAHGLTKAQALQLITLNPAKILGIDAMYGSLETGKSATLFISEGDALDMRTNIISHAFIDGRLISLETHQTELWKRYSEKHQSN
ncbi:amidohydrolase family protein [Algibacter miyuki]|uniref:Amidohydrolase family protein n=1 Tax=Algibacter miyuki TaxID=1306933 RepID=A0ABV5H583_9FLAO|nr:amidohydrolase family protein [Algibacter miyuki]MDN3665685.1 amidohydrolase family protein [Algibacter miyuki]